MIITRISEYSCITRSLELDTNQEEILKYIHGALLQDAFPRLSDDEREFFKSGITPEEWQEMFDED